MSDTYDKKADNGLTYRILIVHNRYQIPGGEDTVVQNECSMLKQHGHSVFLYERNNEELHSYGLKEKLSLPFETIYSHKTKEELKQIIKEHQIDIVHVHNTLLVISPSVYDAAKECQVPVVQTIHNFRFICPNGLLYRNGSVCEECLNHGLSFALKHQCYRDNFLETAIVCAMLKRVRTHHVLRFLPCITLTEFNRTKLLSSGLFSKELMYVKPNAVINRLPPLPYSERKNQIIFAGRLEEIKGILFLLSAWKPVDTNLRFLICGDGPLEELCKTYVKEHQLTNICFLGRISHDELMEHLRESKAMVFASNVYEGFPMSIAESISCGTPVLAPDFGNGGAMIIDGINGFHYTPDSIESFQSQLEVLLHHEFDTEAMSKTYNEEDNYNSLMNIYQEVIERNTHE